VKVEQSSGIDLGNTIAHIVLQLHDTLFRVKSIMVSGHHWVSLSGYAPWEHSVATGSTFESVHLRNVPGYHPARYADVPAECIATDLIITDPDLAGEGDV